jgi:hypothetical protein
MGLLFRRWKRSPYKEASGGCKMERLIKPVDESVEYETILDEEDAQEACSKDDFGPPDLADQAYEAWRDEKRSTEESKE